MKNLIGIILALFLILSCENNSDYNHLISKIENDNLFNDLKEFNFTQRGEFNFMFYNDSIQFLYHKSDTLNYIFSSTNNPIFDSIGEIYFPEINNPQKIFIYKSDNKYSAKRIYTANGSLKTDSISIDENDYIERIFDKSNFYYDLNKEFGLNTFIYDKYQDTYEFALKPDERLFYIKNSKNLQKSIQLRDGWFVAEDEI